MKQFILFLLVSILSISAYAQKYVKVWSDEFNVPGLPDSTKWDYEVGYVRNSELQYYTYKRSENARIQDTVLIIEAHKESFEGADYTSASLFSMYKGDWLYGKFEISATVPAGRGTWPAIWMMPTDDHYGGWPRSGEIDIMEYVGFDPFRLHFTLHFEGTDGSGHDDWGTSIFNFQPHDRFNKFSLVWSPDKIEWRLNDYLVHTYKKKSDDPRIWPFNQLFYMILNLAYGGTWGGRQGIDDSKLPHRFYIDYVRIYQLQESEGPFLLTIQAPNGGSVEVFPKMDAYPESTMVTVTALPDKDYVFDKWLHAGSANPMQFEMSKETHLIPIFKKKNELILNGDFYLATASGKLFELFPNPAGGFVNLTNRSNKILQPTIQLFNLQGQLITTLLEKSSIDPGKQIRLSLEDCHAANGFYLVRISTNGKSSTHPLIINR